jgi:hypothetical protein
VATRLLVLHVVSSETDTEGIQHRFRVIDPSDHDVVMTVMASERDAVRINEGMVSRGAMLTRGAQTSFWAEFTDPIVVVQRDPLPREIARKMGLSRRFLTWRPKREPRPRPHKAGSHASAAKPPGVVAGCAYAAVMVGGGTTLIVAQGYGVLSWLFLGFAIYFFAAFLTYQGLRLFPLDVSWREGLALGLPVPVVALIGFIVRPMVHPEFSWSNVLQFLHP